MEAITDLQLMPLQQRQINACRMYLQVTTLAEIMDHTGTLLLPQAIPTKATNLPPSLHDISMSTLDWPVIHLPSLQCWKLWTRTIRTLFTGDANGIRLATPLGPWLANYQDYRRWLWRMSPNGSLLHLPVANAHPRAAILVQQT